MYNKYSNLKCCFKNPKIGITHSYIYIILLKYKNVNAKYKNVKLLVKKQRNKNVKMSKRLANFIIF